MRICLVYDCLFPYTIGGAERWYRSLFERLAADGHQITYVTLRQWQLDDPPYIDGVEVVAVGPRMALYTRSGRRRILPPLLFGLGVCLHLLRHGRRYEVVHTCAFPYFSLLAAALVRPLIGFELVVDWFEVWSRTYWLRYLGARAGRVGAAVQHMCALVPQRAFCFSQLHAGRLRDEGLRGTATVLHGLYAGDRVTPGPPDRESLALFVGRLIPEKQATLAVAALALAAKRVVGLRATFLGEGPERQALNEAIASHGLQHAVSAPGFADHETLDAEMRRAMCLLVPSRREGYGLVVVEAAARGTPSVVLPAEDNAAIELIEEGCNGYLAAGCDAEALSEAIVRVHAASPEIHRRTAAWFAANRERLSLDSSMQVVLDSYRRRRSGAESPGAPAPAAPSARP